MKAFLRGADLSSLPEAEACGARFFDRDGREGDALRILALSGVDLVRLRLWHDPYSETGEPYGGGTCDLTRVTDMARRVRALGLDWMLSFHYSDFWVDPGKQTLPKAWRDLSPEALERAVYAYTRSVLTALRGEGLTPAIVGVGNEITNGLLWPHGQVPRWENIVRFVGAGIRAVREAAPEAKVLLHLDNGGNAALYRDWFDQYFARGGEDFDWIGLSYYPYWHGRLADLEGNLQALAARHGKPLLVTETSAGFTLEDYADREGLAGKARRGMAATAERASAVPFPMTEEGQRRYLRELAARIRRTPDGLGRGFIWWEPAWIPVPGSGSGSAAGWAYAGEPGPGGNEWANQAWFDYEGRALPVLDTLRDL